MHGPNLALVRPDAPVAAIMRSPVATVSEQATLPEVADVLVDNEIGIVAVVRHDHVLGVVSERDLVAHLAAGRWPDETTAADIMTTDLLSVRPDEPIIAAAQRANAAQVRHLPVLEDGALRGVLSIRDLLAVLVSSVDPS